MNPAVVAILAAAISGGGIAIMAGLFNLGSKVGSLTEATDNLSERVSRNENRSARSTAGDAGEHQGVKSEGVDDQRAGAMVASVWSMAVPGAGSACDRTMAGEHCGDHAGGLGRGDDTGGDATNADTGRGGRPVTPALFKLPCTCGSPSEDWQDHGTGCPFARYGVMRTEAQAATRRLIAAAALFCGFLLGIALALVALR